MAIIYDFPAASARCLPRVARGREGKSFKGTYLASENSSQCQFLKRNQGGELVHIQIYALRLDVKRVTYLSVGMKWSHCPIKGYKLGRREFDALDQFTIVFLLARSPKPDGVGREV